MYRQDDFGCAKFEQEINGPAVLTAGLLRCIITLLLFFEECGFSMFLLTNRFLEFMKWGKVMLKKWYAKVIFFILYSFASYCTVQLFLDANPFTIGVNGIARNMFLFMIYYGVLLCFFRKMRPALLFGGILMILIGGINYLVLQFRGYGIIFMDFYAVSTAMTVAGRYTVKIIPCLIAAIAVAVLQIVAVCGLLPKETAWKLRGSLIGLVVCVGMTVGMFGSGLLMDGVSSVYWDHQIGMQKYGYFVYFLANAQVHTVSEPEGYSKAAAQKILQQYEKQAASTGQEQSPNLIMIMNEAFSDLRVWGDFQTNQAVMPFWDSLQQNTVKGFAQSSVYGGYTANSEFEFLTGCTKAFLPGNPYLEYIHTKTPSLLWDMKNRQGSFIYAMHPYNASGYNRNRVYPLIGVDSFVTKEEFVGAKKVRGLISDEADYDKMIDLYEQQKGDKPFVMFNVTMQNHNPYTKKSSFKEPIKVTSFQADPEVEQYLSLIHESDAALQKLIAYYEKQSEQAVIVFFGDHQPHLPDSFYFQMTGKIPAGFSREEALKKYEVPFFIWANYDITEKEINHISLNYLSTEMAVDTRQSMSAYQCFLQAMQQEISSLSDNGCYDAEGRYYTLEEAPESMQQWIREYKILQYYMLFDGQER